MADGHDSLIVAHTDEFRRINTRLNDEETMTKKFIEVTANQRASIDFIHERLDRSEKQVDAILALGTSVQHMVDEMKKTSTNVEKIIEIQHDLNLRVVDIEREQYDTRFDKLDLRMNEMAVAINTLTNKPAQIIAAYATNTFKAVLIALALYVLYSLFPMIKG